VVARPALEVPLNYAVPFIVATWGILGAGRGGDETHASGERRSFGGADKRGERSPWQRYPPCTEYQAKTRAEDPGLRRGPAR
jgi:hypothetical protein